MKTVILPGGERVVALGQGTWFMGEALGARKAEVAALQAGLDLGLTLIDTAEMYAEGGAEEVVGEALAGRRDEAFIVSKVYPHNASRQGAVAAWLLGQEGVIAIPKSTALAHVRENAAAGQPVLSAAQRAELDRLFAPPQGPSPLEML